MAFSAVEEHILDRLQREVALSPRPYGELAASLGIDETACIDIVSRLRRDGVVRSIAGIFNAEALGYASTLVALRVPAAAIEAAAAAVNGHPGVSHNYLRDHSWNVWFTLAVDDPKKLEPTVRRLAEMGSADDYLILKNERLFKIGVVLPINNSRSRGSTVAAPASTGLRKKRTLTEEEREAVRVLQYDLPAEADAFAAVIRAAGSGLDVGELLVCANNLKADGIIRRYAAVIRHRAAGFTANAMTAWRPKPGVSIDDVAAQFAGVQMISHLYLRTTHPGRWEHPLFAMIHARSEEELESVIDGLAISTGITEYMVLRSIREFKKERVTYFSPNFSEWEQREGI